MRLASSRELARAVALARTVSLLQARDPRAHARARRILERAWWLERARLAPAFDAAATQGFGFTSPWSWSHTASGDDRAVLVALHTVNTVTVSSITYGGVGMSLVDTVAPSSGRLFLYELAAPATGGQTISATFSANTRGVGGAVSFTAVNQDAPTGTTVQESNTAADGTIVVSASPSDLVVDFAHKQSGVTTAYTVGADQTQRYQTTDGENFLRAACSTEPGAASVTMSWTGWAVAGTTAHLGVPVQALPAGAALLFLLAAFGLGWRA